VVSQLAALVGVVVRGVDCVWVFAGDFAADGKSSGAVGRPFDLVLLLVLSHAVQNAMNGGITVSRADFVDGTLVGLHWGVAWLTYHSKTVESLVEGRPVLLIHNGHVDKPGAIREGADDDA